MSADDAKLIGELRDLARQQAGEFDGEYSSFGGRLPNARHSHYWKAAERLTALIAERDRLAGQVQTIHSIALETTPHRGCACTLCRIRRVCDGREIEPDPAKLLPDRLCDWRKRSEDMDALTRERNWLLDALKPFRDAHAELEKSLIGGRYGFSIEKLAEARAAYDAINPTQPKGDAA
jgi:hypothetical protein